MPVLKPGDLRPTGRGQGNALKIFISYSSRDRPDALRLKEILDLGAGFEWSVPVVLEVVVAPVQSPHQNADGRPPAAPQAGDPPRHAGTEPLTKPCGKR
jgi:hypothetical protein